MSTARQPLHPDERVGSADETVPSPRELRRKELIVVLAREVAVQQDGPDLGIDVLVAQRREGDPHLERPAALGDLRGRLPEKIGRRILVRRVVVHRVVLDVSWRDDEEGGGPPGVAWVDEDAAVVVEAVADVVAVRKRRADGLRIRILELERGIKKVIVVGQIPDVANLRLDVVARLCFVPLVDARGISPAFVREIAVNNDGAGRPSLCGSCLRTAPTELERSASTRSAASRAPRPKH